MPRLAVGLVGLGAIGRPMATRLAAADHLDLHVHDLAPDPVAALVAAGATASGTVADLAAAVEVLHVVVRDDEQVTDVLDQALRGARPGLVVAIHSTVAPGTPARLAARAEECGVLLVDAPVSGGAVGASEGTLAIMVGGSPEAFARVEPVLRVLGSRVVHAGPVGAGTRMKLARNLVQFVSFAAVTEAQRLAEAAGLDLAALGEVVRHSDAVTGGPGAIMHRTTTAPVEPGDPWLGILEHVHALGDKDLRLAADLARELGVDVPLTELARQRLGPGLGLATGGTA